MNTADWTAGNKADALMTIWLRHRKRASSLPLQLLHNDLPTCLRARHNFFSSEFLWMANMKEQDNWSPDAYQKAASFVPKLATRIVQWLDAQPHDNILDIGCGDGILTHQVAQTLTTGSIHGIDSSASMISSAEKLTKSSPSSAPCTFEVLDAKKLLHHPSLQNQSFTKVFSNAALHWILRPASSHSSVFQGVSKALKPNGIFVFEMGGLGNVAEARAALLAAVGRRIGIQRAREIDPWFFPDEEWMRNILGQNGFVVEKAELGYRQTPLEKGEGGGVEGWIRLMAKQFLDAVGGEGTKEREDCVKEVVDTLETVCASPGGDSFLGYVRLRVMARKV